MTETVSNVFHFTFEVAGLEPPLRTMLPETKEVARRMAERMLKEEQSQESKEAARKLASHVTKEKETASLYHNSV